MGAAVVVALGVWASPAWAQFSDVKTLRLGDAVGDAPAVKLGEAGQDADTELVRSARGGGFHGGGFHSGGFHHGGFHSGFHHGGFHNGFHHGGFHNGFRHVGFHNGFNRGFNRSFYSFGYRPYFYGYRNFYYPRYYGYGYGGYGYGGYGYYSPYYYTPSYYYYSPLCSYPISITTSTLNGSLGSYSPVMPLAPENGTPAPPPGGGGDGTFPYDGGPTNPVPMPKADPVPSRDPVRPAPKPEGRIVSLPGSTQFAYPAYGEKPAPTSFGQDRLAVLKSEPVKAARR